MADLAIDWSDALATLAATANGVSGIRKGTSTELDGVGSLPAVLVQRLQSLAIDDSIGGRNGAVQDHYRATVEGLLILPQPGKTSTSRIDGSELLAALFRAYRQGIKLAQANVVVDSWLASAEWDDALDVGDGLPGYRLTWVVLVRETFDVTPRTA